MERDKMIVVYNSRGGEPNQLFFQPGELLNVKWKLGSDFSIFELNTRQMPKFITSRGDEFEIDNPLLNGIYSSDIILEPFKTRFSNN